MRLWSMPRKKGRSRALHRWLDGMLAGNGLVEIRWSVVVEHIKGWRVVLVRAMMMGLEQGWSQKG
jgi:hypothetical protein